MRKNFLTYAAPLAVLLLVGAGCFGSKTTTVAPAPAPAPTPQGIAPGEPAPGTPGGPATGTRVRGNVILAQEQKPGRSVKIQVLYNDAPAFIVVREQDQLGPTLGTSAVLSAGENSNVIIDLSRESKDGESLYATVHVDDGNGIFDRNDKPMLGADGDEVFIQIPINKDAVERPNPVL